MSPVRGLYAAIVGAFLVSALGESRYQTGSPAGAFIVLVSGRVVRFSVDGMLLAVLVSGMLLTLVGALRLGSLTRHVPHAMNVAFTAGIACTIPTSHSRKLEGLRLRVIDGVVTVLARVTKIAPAGRVSKVPARPRTVLEFDERTA